MTVYPPDTAPEEDAIEAGRILFAHEAGFVAGVATIAGLPPDGLPEIAFAGRSNVGKSSLLNALTGRTSLARVSHTPGRTRQLNAMPRRPSPRSPPGPISSSSICAAVPGCAASAC